MATTKKAAKKAATKKKPAAKPAVDAKAVLAWLERKGTKKNADGMARYGIVAQKVFGVSVGTLRDYAKTIGKSHALALALWDTGWYEARMLSAFVDEPALVTAKQMDSWCKDFDNWAITDTVCFHLFDKTPHAYGKVKAWAKRKPEFEKRASFALLASLALHDKKAEDALFLPTFALMDQAADDERNFVKKAVSWALHGVGQRSPELHKRAMVLGKELRDAEDPTRRWIGRDVLRELEKKNPKQKVRT
jgi:3-methyladenine DNA glycosylase AlkD